jgi:hypothetical protein
MKNYLSVGFLYGFFAGGEVGCGAGNHTQYLTARGAGHEAEFFYFAEGEGGE